MMNYSFDDCVSPIIETALKVDIDEAFQKQIYAFVEELVKSKKRELHHKYDNHQEIKRFSTGFLGEAALEKLFNIRIIDWSIDESALYHTPDIPGYSVGIKTVEYGKFPIIFKKNNYPQIICILDNQNRRTVYVCGLGTVDVLNTYQSDDLILDNNLRKRGTKTGFYGFEHLIHISSIQDLESYKKTEQIYNPTRKKCPQCGNILIAKNGKYGKFWGCSNYPSCNHTENYVISTTKSE